MRHLAGQSTGSPPANKPGAMEDGMKIRISPASEYGKGDGYVIEMKAYWNFRDEETWAIPDWEENDLPFLAGIFATRKAAERALRTLHYL